jgi:hypothetical protein
LLGRGLDWWRLQYDRSDFWLSFLLLLALHLLFLFGAFTCDKLTDGCQAAYTHG